MGGVAMQSRGLLLRRGKRVTEVRSGRGTRGKAEPGGAVARSPGRTAPSWSGSKSERRRPLGANRASPRTGPED